MSIEEIEHAVHQGVYLPPVESKYLLAELKKAQEKLESVREYGQLLARDHARGTWQGIVKAELDRILQGGE